MLCSSWWGRGWRQVEREIRPRSSVLWRSSQVLLLRLLFRSPLRRLLPHSDSKYSLGVYTVTTLLLGKCCLQGRNVGRLTVPASNITFAVRCEDMQR